MLGNLHEIILYVSVGDIHSPAPGVQVADCRDPEGNRFSIECCGSAE